jgi:hypothetical protein
MWQKIGEMEAKIFRAVVDESSLHFIFTLCRMNLFQAGWKWEVKYRFKYCVIKCNIRKLILVTEET